MFVAAGFGIPTVRLGKEWVYAVSPAVRQPGRISRSFRPSSEVHARFTRGSRESGVTRAYGYSTVSHRGMARISSMTLTRTSVTRNVINLRDY